MNEQRRCVSVVTPVQRALQRSPRAALTQEYTAIERGFNLGERRERGVGIERKRSLNVGIGHINRGIERPAIEYRSEQIAREAPHDIARVENISQLV